MSEGRITQVELKTVPFDPRFPYSAQTKNCWQNFVDFHKCSNKLGEDNEHCQWFKKTYISLCPRAWIETWTEQVENGTFPGRI
ncbi:predicted protein [Nematostella vectensis]|uniref:Cytochrome c oxidase subunit n=1 Tax=Nematostella vectensis TaxID=45351 RepID=A7RJL7_NEMVE|nr:predicted protein [Nematostella vectensis]|eukprot:XP_001640464.1 predicted protein [Nematostella vectensis]